VFQAKGHSILQYCHLGYASPALASVVPSLTSGLDFRCLRSCGDVKDQGSYGHSKSGYHQMGYYEKPLSCISRGAKLGDASIVLIECSASKSHDTIMISKYLDFKIDIYFKNY